MQTSTLAYLVLAFSEFAREGMGPRRGRADLVTVALCNESGEAETVVFQDGAFLKEEVVPLRLSLEPCETLRRPEKAQAGDLPHGVRVRFVTPTELKSAQRPEFGVLACRIRDRVSTLRSLYGDGPLPIDFRDFGERASRVRMTRCAIRHVDAVRKSSRTGQVHPIGGFVGEAEYEGEVGEFIPYLRVARWTGVGRQTVWGKGEIQVDEL
jgi:hypothetical protein